MQAILRLGHYFNDAIRNIVDIEQQNNIHSLINEFILASYQENQELTTFRVRDLLGNPNYTDRTQQDAFWFWLDIYASLHPNIKNYFKLQETTTITCSVCNESSLRHRFVDHITISPRHTQSYTKFEETFVGKSINVCEFCNQNVEETSTRTYAITPETRYILLYVNTFHFVDRQARHINSRITNFNFDNFLLPSSNRLNLCRFRIKSAIVRLGETINAGHYYIWTRQYNNDGWVKISDTNINQYSKFTNSQNNVQLFFAEKI